MNTTTVVQASSAIRARIIANVKKTNSSKEKKDRPSSKRETYQSSEDEDTEVPETPKSSKRQKSGSSDTQNKFRHSKNILRHDTTSDGLFPLFRNVLSAIGVKNWDPEWTEWETVESFLSTCSQSSNSTADADLKLLKTRDPSLLGIRTFIFVYLCQLNPNTVSLKVIYAKAYWMLSFWHLLEVDTPLAEDVAVNTWAAVNIVPEGKKITKRYFQAFSTMLSDGFVRLSEAPTRPSVMVLKFEPQIDRI